MGPRFATSLIVAVFLGGCSYAGLEIDGKKCDPAHPCPSGFVCVSSGDQSVCRPESADGGESCLSNDDCDDANACTADFCIYDLCQHSDFPDGLNCDDGDPCTSLDRCESGVCLGTSRDCSSYQGVCQVGVCNPESGTCLAEPAENDADCDDGLYCTVSERCWYGLCEGIGRNCDDGDPCTLDTCNETDDDCDNLIEPLPGQEGVLVDGSCDNQLDDDCDGLTDLADPNCLACSEDGECDDSNPCTSDSCTDEVCVNQPVGGEPACDDGRFCTVNDRCMSGICSGDPRDCSDDIHPCNVGVCLESSQTCGHQPEPNGSPCDDGKYCTVADVCTDGLCAGTIRDCEDGDFCTVDTCDGDLATCVNQMVPLPGAEGPPGEPNCQNQIDDDCDGLTDNLDPNCMNCSSDDDCDDSNPCTDDGCEGNVCLNEPGEAGASCDDGAYCNGTEQCDNQGSCVSSGDPCLANPECQRNCDEQSDSCNDYEGTPCGDPAETECNLADTCDGQGACRLNLVNSDTPCGNPPQHPCDAQDTCDQDGQCIDNLHPAGNRCDGDDLVTCDGQGGWNLVENCPLGCNLDENRCNLLDPSNVDPSLLCASTEAFDPDNYTGNGIFCINTDDEMEPAYHCFDWVPLTEYQPEVVNIVSQAGGPDIMVLSFASIFVNTDITIYAAGSRAVALLSCGDVTIRGKIVAAGDNGVPGAGGGVGGDARSDGDGLGYDGYGRWNHAGAQPSPGGGGAGFGGTGGHGGDIAGGLYNDPGGAGGSAYGNQNLVPLIGGAGGGGGDDEWPIDGHNSLGGRGGEGGGGLQISSGGHLEIESGGVLGAPGLAGEAAWALNNTFGAGGGGGGAGGGILLEAVSLQIDGTLAANGGGGGGGGTGAAMDGEHGRLDAVPAGGGYGDDSANGSYGGNGGAGDTPSGQPGETDDVNSGGGGGAAGRIRLNTSDIEDLTLGAASIISPSQDPGPGADCTGLCTTGPVQTW